MATNQPRVYWNTVWTVGRLCLLASAVIILLYAFGVITNTDKVYWDWIGVGLGFLGLFIG